MFANSRLCRLVDCARLSKVLKKLLSVETLIEGFPLLAQYMKYFRGGTASQYAPSTVRDIFKHFRKIIRAAVDEGYVVANPFKRIRLPKVDRVEQRFLTEDQVERLVGAIDDRYKVLIYVAAYLGLRWEEVSALKSADLELDQPVARLHVRGTLPRSDGKAEYRMYGKSEASRRSLKIPSFLREALAFQLAGYSSRAWVFPAPKGAFLRYEHFRGRVWVPATLDAGISSDRESFTFHELRHTAAAFMFDERADPLQIMRRMGHSDIRTTYNLYGHLFPDREDELVGKLDRRYRWATEGSRGLEERGKTPFGFRSDYGPREGRNGCGKHGGQWLTRENTQWAYVDAIQTSRVWATCVVAISVDLLRLSGLGLSPTLTITEPAGRTNGPRRRTARARSSSGCRERVSLPPPVGRWSSLGKMEQPVGT